MLNLIKKIGRFLVYLVSPSLKVYDEIIVDANPKLDNPEHDELYNQLLQPGRLQMRDIDGNPIMEVVDRSKIKEVRDVLGPYYGPLVEWAHPEEMFLLIEVVRGWLVDDNEWFFNYIERNLSESELKEFPINALPIKIDKSELIRIADNVQWAIAFENSRLFNVCWRDVYGMIMINHDDVGEIVRTQVDVEQKEKEEGEEDVDYFVCTFIQFKTAAIQKLKLEPIQRNEKITMQVNFAV